jgi:DNA polymerase-4
MQLAFFRGVSWAPEMPMPETDSTVLLMRQLERLWRDRPEPRAPILQVGVVLSGLVERNNYTPELFQAAVADLMTGNLDKQRRLDAAIDKLRARYGRSVVYFGTVQESREAAPMRISFTHIPDLQLEQD